MVLSEGGIWNEAKKITVFKRLLSVMLVIGLCMGMTVSAFAANTSTISSSLYLTTSDTRGDETAALKSTTSYTDATLVVSSGIVTPYLYATVYLKNEKGDTVMSDGAYLTNNGTWHLSYLSGYGAKGNSYRLYGRAVSTMYSSTTLVYKLTP